MNYIPNIISGLRILLIPVFALFLSNNYYLAALYLFIVMGISDALDGIIARYLKCESVLGSYLDATADKIMINTSFFFLCSMNILPFYLFYIVLIRDLIILIAITLRYNIEDSVMMNPIFLSKLNTFLQITLVIFCMLFLNNIINLTYIQDITNAVVLTTIFSFIEYIYNYRNNNALKNIRYTSEI